MPPMAWVYVRVEEKMRFNRGMVVVWEKDVWWRHTKRESIFSIFFFFYNHFTTILRIEKVSLGGKVLNSDFIMIVYGLSYQTIFSFFFWGNQVKFLKA